MKEKDNNGKQQIDDVMKIMNIRNQNEIFKNRAIQLRIESAASLVTIRDSNFPATDNTTKNEKVVPEMTFQKIKVLTEMQRKQFGKLIFERIINYLRILAAKGLYPRNSLLDQVQILLNDNVNVFVQLVPKQLGRSPIPINK